MDRKKTVCSLGVSRVGLQKDIFQGVFKKCNKINSSCQLHARCLSHIQSVTKRQIHVEIICLCIYLLALGVIYACEWPLRNPTCPSSVMNFKEYLMATYLVS